MDKQGFSIEIEAKVRKGGAMTHTHSPVFHVKLKFSM